MKKILLFAALAAAFSPDLSALAPTDFKMKLPIAVNAEAVGEKSATDLPVLVRLSESISGFSYSDLAADGSDLAFGVDDGTAITVYPHEIDTWDATGESLVWVKVPTVAAGTTFNAYYGNGASGGMAASATWSNYTGVWHLNDTNSASAYGTYPNSSSLGTLADGEKAELSIAEQEGRFGKSFRVNDGGCNSGNFNYGGVFVNDSDALGVSNVFTLSGWFKHADQNYYYDHFFYKRERNDNGSGTSGETGAFAIELSAKNQIANKFTIKGNGSSAYAPSPATTYNYKNWNYFTFVFNKTSCTLYVNGDKISSGTINEASRNSSRLAFGNNICAYGNGKGDAAYCGWIDEVRLSGGAVCSDDYVALEYAAMATDGFLSFGTPEQMDEDAASFVGEPSVAVGGDGVVANAEVASGKGSLGFAYWDLATGAAVTNTVVAAFEGARSFSDTPTLADDTMYSFCALATTAKGTVVRKSGPNFYTGELTVAAGDDAEESALTPGTFVISRGTATEGDLVVAYAVAGGEGGYTAPSGTVTIPDGATSATVEITPVYTAEIAEDVAVTLTLAAGAYGIGATGASASITIRNSATSAFIRYVSPTGDDANDGLTPQTAKMTVAAAVTSLDDSTAEPSTVYIAPGIYKSTARLMLTNSVSLVGLGDDPSCVMLSNTATRTMLVTLNNPKSGVYNLTLAKGMAYQTGAPGGSNLLIDENGGTASNCWIVAGEANNYNGHGGGASIKAGLITHCVIKDNFVSTVGADNKAGGIEIYGGLVENCLIAYNRDTGAGTGTKIAAGVYISGGTIRNCTVAGNAGQTTGGLVVNGENARIENCLIAGNTAAVSGGDAASYLVANDAYKACFDACAVDATVAPNENCLAAATATLIADVVNGDCHLAAGSPAIDAGRTQESGAALHDLDGNDRVRGSAIDIGCYESDPNVFLVTFDADVYSGILPVPVNFAATVSGADASDTVAYDWDFDGDGVVDLTVEGDPTVSYSYLSGGTFDVTLTVRDITSGKTASVTKNAFLQFAPRTLYVNAEAAEHVVPFATPETGALTIQDAVDAAVDGCEIVIYSGAYGITREILVEKALDIHGLTGEPEDVVVTRATSGVYRIFNLNNGAAKVSGVVMENGRVNGSGGGAATFGILGGMISNAVIRGCSCYNYSGAGGAVSLGYTDAFVTHCVISNCWTETMNGTGGNKGVVQLDNGRVENCLITENYSMKGTGEDDAPGNIVQIGAKGSLVNCTIVKNRTLTRSIVYLTDPAARMINCVVAGNEAGTETACPTAGYGSKVTDPAACLDHCEIDPELTVFRDFAAGNFVPKTGGLLVNGGVTPSGWEKLVDLVGKPRVIGKAIDIGCYEGALGGLQLYLR